MKPLYVFAVGALIIIHGAIGAEGQPDPYQTFDKERANNHPILTNKSSRVRGDALPDLAGRPSTLRPGPLPKDVRYSFAADSSVTDAAALLTNRFCGALTDDASPFGKFLVVQPGAWMRLKLPHGLGITSATPWGFLVWDGRTTQKLSGIVLRDKDELAEVARRIRLEVRLGGGATVRALSTAEMKKWWPFIGFDIHEPTLILETKDSRRLFVFGFVDRQILMLDELNGLPDLEPGIVK